MSVTLNLTGPNKWQRVYFQSFEGNPQNARYRAPLIEPFELPFLFDSHVLAISVACRDARPRWRTAGWLHQTYSGINLDSETTFIVNSPTAGVDAANIRVGLNTLELIVLPKLSNDFYLWFDPVPWLPRLTLGLWEFTGEVSDSYLEQFESLKVNLLRVESKVDAINQG